MCIITVRAYLKFGHLATIEGINFEILKCAEYNKNIAVSLEFRVNILSIMPKLTCILRKFVIPLISLISITSLIISLNPTGDIEEPILKQNYYSIEILKNRVEEDKKNFENLMAGDVNIDDLINEIEDDFHHWNNKTVLSDKDILSKSL